MGAPLWCRIDLEDIFNSSCPGKYNHVCKEDKKCDTMLICENNKCVVEPPPVPLEPDTPAQPPAPASICNHDDQCEKGYCHNTILGNKICRKYAKEGDTCFFSSTKCADGLVCDSTKRCITSTSKSDIPVMLPYQHEGSDLPKDKYLAITSSHVKRSKEKHCFSTCKARARCTGARWYEKGDYKGANCLLYFSPCVTDQTCPVKQSRSGVSGVTKYIHSR